MTVLADLAAITGKVLSSLGELTMQALFWELSRQGVTTNPDEFDIRRFDEEMKKIFGDGANVFMGEIYMQFKEAVERKYGGQGVLAQAELASLEPVERIQKILSMKVIS